MTPIKEPIEEIPSGARYRRGSDCARGSFLAVAASTLVLALGWMYRPNQPVPPVREGVVAYAGWMAGERSGHFVSRTEYGEVPGGNGGGNTHMDVYGRLFPGHLELSYPGQPDRGVTIIPMNQLVTVTFGDAGIADLSVGRRAVIHAVEVR